MATATWRDARSANTSTSETSSVASQRVSTSLAVTVTTRHVVDNYGILLLILGSRCLRVSSNSPNTKLGDVITTDALDGGFEQASLADLCVVFGSSLTVTPAADIPLVSVL